MKYLLFLSRLAVSNTASLRAWTMHPSLRTPIDPTKKLRASLEFERAYFAASFNSLSIGDGKYAEEVCGCQEENNMQRLSILYRGFMMLRK